MKFNFQYKNFITLALTCCLLSCAKSPEKQTHAQEIMEEAKRIQTQNTRIPEAVSSALLDAATSPEIADIEERFNVSVNQVPAKTFFISLVSDSGVNVVAHPEVAGSISLELKNVTVKEVLDVTREVYGYEYKVSNGIYTIFPRKLRTEIFQINYLDIQRVGVTDTSVLIGEITSDSNSSNNGNNSSNNNNNSNNSNSTNLLEFLPSDGAGSSSNTSSSSGISPGSRVQTLSKTDFWTGLSKSLLTIIGGDKEGRFVMANPHSGLIVVKAMPRELSSVRKFLADSELSVKRQVILETKILEVRLNDSHQSGINWGAITGSISAQQNNIGDVSLNDVFGGDGEVESLVSTVVNVTDITNLLLLLETQGNVQVLSSPRIATVNNQKAIIRVGSDEFFVTGISNSTTSSAASIVNTPEVDLDSFFSGISLDVTPQISENGEVVLHVHPIVSNVQDQIKEIDVAGNNFSLPLALRDIRESDSIVKAKSGQVVVLGGLMQETTQDVTTKRPVLGDIPVVNWFFKRNERSLVKTELVILMQPIVVEDGTWEQQVAKESLRIDGISDLYLNR